MPFGYGFFHEVTGDRPGNELPGGRPPVVGGGPIVPPPLPGVWPPPGMPNFPIDPNWGVRPPGVDSGWGQGHPLPPHVGGGPIVIPQPPPGMNPPITMPPPGIYPPLPPTGLPPGVHAALVKVLGSDTIHWIVVDTSVHPGTPLPPSAQPK
jgi:hypothetical protein